MNRSQKIASLDKALIEKTRNDGTTFKCFSDEAPKELRDLFLEHYEVRDQDYEIFYSACIELSVIYADVKENEDIEDAISERLVDLASIYNSDRIALLNVYNEEEIADIIRDFGSATVSEACAVWYDRAVEEAANIINNWVKETTEL